VEELVHMDRRQRAYVYLAGIFVTCLLVADITGGKFFHIHLFDIGEFQFVTHSTGMLAFPITFLLTDLVNEYYGRRGAVRLTILGLFMAALAFALILAARHMPVAPNSPIPQEAFESVFKVSNRLYVASLTAYLIGQLCDISIFQFIKRRTGDRLVWLRATGSTMVSQAIDSFTVSYILMVGTMHADGTPATFPEILEIAATGYILKFFLAIALTPLIYLGRRILHGYFGLKSVPPRRDT
jgi:uncharacterized integral membrane protein (TIGR00697 family)